MEMNDWYINKSNIHGDGVFTRRHFHKHEPISIIFIKVHDSGIPATDLVRTEFCKYINHHNNGNCGIYKKKHFYILKALRNLIPDEEITTNYNDNLAKMISGGFPEKLNGRKDSLIFMPHSSHMKNIDDYPDLDMELL
jgi:hypothetical protein